MSPASSPRSDGWRRARRGTAQSTRRATSWRAGIEGKARVSSLKPTVLEKPAVSVVSFAKPAHAGDRVEEPPGRAEPQRGIMAGERGEFARIGGLVEREQDDRQALLVAEAVEQRLQRAHVVGRRRNVGALVAAELCEQSGLWLRNEPGWICMTEPVVAGSSPPFRSASARGTVRRRPPEGASRQHAREQRLRLSGAQGRRSRRSDGRGRSRSRHAS